MRNEIEQVAPKVTPPPTKLVRLVDKHGKVVKINVLFKERNLV